MRKALVSMLAFAACGGSAPEIVKPGPVAPPPVVDAIPKVQGKDGVVFSPDGNGLELRVLATGDSVLVQDGTPLKLINEQSGKGFGRADAEVEIAGQVGILPNSAVLAGERMRISPVAKVALFIATRQCEPDCVADVWALHPDGRRLLISNNISDASFAFSPDGLQIAVGGKGLWLLNIGTWRVLSYKEFAAPNFAPDSSLYVRSLAGSDAVMRLFAGGQATEVASEPGLPSAGVPEPVTFEDGGKTIVAIFARKGGPKTLRVAR